LNNIGVWAETLKAIPWVLILQISVIGIVVLIAKKYYENISSYFMFRANKDLSKNVKVIVNGDKGVISYYTWKFIYVKLSKSGNELVIPITRWTSLRWEIDKNGIERDLKET